MKKSHIFNIIKLGKMKVIQSKKTDSIKYSLIILKKEKLKSYK